MSADQWVALVAGIVGGALRVGAPFLFVSLGECLTEKSGRINLGLEGVLVLSAMAAFGGAYLTDSAWLGVLIGALLLGVLARGILFRKLKALSVRTETRADDALLEATRRFWLPAILLTSILPAARLSPLEVEQRVVVERFADVTQLALEAADTGAPSTAPGARTGTT